MNKKKPFFAVMASVMMMMSACGSNADTSTNVSSEVPPVSSPSSEPSESPAVTEHSAPQNEVITQTKIVEGFTGGQVNNGTMYINGGIVKLGSKLLDVDSALAKGGTMISGDKEEIKTRTSFGDGYVDYISKDGMHYTMAMQFEWYNPWEEQDVKFIDTVLCCMEVRTVSSESVQSYDEVGPDRVQETEAVLPNGWYLGGTVSVADRMSLLPGFEPDVDEHDEYTWYLYRDEDKETCTLSLKIDNATGKIIEIQLSSSRTRK